MIEPKRVGETGAEYRARLEQETVEAAAVQAVTNAIIKAQPPVKVPYVPPQPKAARKGKVAKKPRLVPKPKKK